MLTISGIILTTFVIVNIGLLPPCLNFFIINTTGDSITHQLAKIVAAVTAIFNLQSLGLQFGLFAEWVGND